MRYINPQPRTRLGRPTNPANISSPTWSPTTATTASPASALRVTGKLRVPTHRLQIACRPQDRPSSLSGDGAPTEELNARQQRVKALVEKLTADIPVDAAKRDEKQSATWLLAQLLDFHRRENKATEWEGYRLAEVGWMTTCLDERSGLGGLKFVERLKVERNIPTDRYSFEKQETEARLDKNLYYGAEISKFGCLVEIDPAALTIDI